MKNKVYAVLDRKVNAFTHTFQMQHKGAAIRGWITECNDPKSEMYLFPDDFELFEVAEFDQSSGLYHNYDMKVSLGTSRDHQKPRNHIRTANEEAALDRQGA